MFRREEHRAVVRVLEALDAGVLDTHHALFGGGTRLVLELGEYRISRDVDFLTSDAPAFADLRSLARRRGAEGFFQGGSLANLDFPREARTDQYGVRFPVVVDGLFLKLEIIHEGRIDLGPGVRPPWSPVTCLDLPDAYSEKLLANSDRWPDRQLLARDLIDLCLLRVGVGAVPEDAWAKAEHAYGPAVRTDLRKALEAFLEDPAFQQRCFEGLTLTSSQAVLEGAAQLLPETG